LWFFSFFFTSFYMLFLNWFVFFKAKQNFSKLYINTQPLSDVKDIPSVNNFRTSLNFSPLLSQLSVFFFLIFFAVIAFVGEFLLFNFFGFLSAVSSPVASAFLSPNTLFFLLPETFSASSAESLSLLISIFLFSALRFLLLLAV
jgi:hypothetical protein